jgi:hypothetical protein
VEKNIRSKFILLPFHSLREFLPWLPYILHHVQGEGGMDAHLNSMPEGYSLSLKIDFSHTLEMTTPSIIAMTNHKKNRSP